MCYLVGMEIWEGLQNLGFSAAHAGTRYLCDCIRIYEDSAGRAKLTEIYDLIAERYHKGASAVGKAMKYALDRALLAGGKEEFWGRLSHDRGTPTVREFVAAFAVYRA